jgi:GPH family glycoside/pentoside/hexuronide:cation symporter
MAKDVVKRLTNKEVFFYNWGSISLNFVEGILITWIMYFYAPPPSSGRQAFIPIILTGMVLTVGRVFDAITDPLIGHLSDNTKSRWGRRTPYIVLGTPFMIFFFLYLWTPPVYGVSDTNVIYLMFIFLLYFLFYTIIGIPYDAVLAEIALTSDDRVKLTSWKLIYAIIGFLLASFIGPFLYHNQSPQVMALVTAIVGLVTMYLCLPGIKELPVGFSHGDVKMGFWDSFKATFTNVQFLFFGLAIVALYMCYQVLLVVIPYFVTVVVGKDESFVMYYMAEFILCMVASIPLWMWLSHKYGKRRMLRFVSLLLAIFFPIIFFVGDIPGISVMVQAFILFPLVSVPLGGFMILVYAMMGDVVDYDQMLTGKRREAMYYGVFGFSRKVGFALSTIILPVLFETFGYEKGDYLGIRLVWIMLGVFSLIGFCILLGYKLGDSPEETRKIMGIKKK